MRAVLGTLLSNSWKTIRPEGFESIAMSNFEQFDMIRFARKKKQQVSISTHEYIRPRGQGRSVIIDEHSGSA